MFDRRELVRKLRELVRKLESRRNSLKQLTLDDRAVAQLLIGITITAFVVIILMVIVNFVGTSMMNAAAINNTSVFYNASQQIGPNWTSASQMILIALVAGAAIVILGMILGVVGRGL